MKEKRPYHFSRGWFDQYKQDIWTEHLGHLFKKEPCQYLEIGVYDGQSFLWAVDRLMSHPKSRAYAVDRFHMPEVVRGFDSNVKKCRFKNRIVKKKGYSNLTLKKFKREQFDVIHIDGAHDAKNVVRDMVLCWELLKPEGFLILDDYKMVSEQMPSELRPEASIDFFITAYRSELQVLHKDFICLVQKKADVTVGLQRSRCGPYLINWYSKTVMGPEGEEPLTPAEFEVLLKAYSTLRCGEDELDLKLPEFQEPVLQQWMKKNGLELRDFSNKEIRKRQF